MADQLIDTKRTRTEHLSFTATTIGSKYLTINSAFLCDKIIPETNQASAFIYRRGHGYQEFPFKSQKSGNKMTVDFGRNTDDKIGMNPSRTIGITHPQINMNSTRKCNIFDLISRGMQWHGTIKIKLKT